MNKIENIDVYFEIRENDNYIRLEPIEYLYSNSIHDWDKNCIQTKVSVKGGQFSGEYFADLMTTDFESIKQELRELYNNLNGKLLFNDLEYFLEIVISGNGLGHFIAEVTTNDRGSELSTSKLTFYLEFDQTQINDLVKQKDLITRAFPITDDLNLKILSN